MTVGCLVGIVYAAKSTNGSARRVAFHRNLLPPRIGPRNGREQHTINHHFCSASALVDGPDSIALHKQLRIDGASNPQHSALELGRVLSCFRSCTVADPKITRRPLSHTETTLGGTAASSSSCISPTGAKGGKLILNHLSPVQLRSVALHGCTKRPASLHGVSTCPPWPSCCSFRLSPACGAAHAKDG